MLRKGYLQLKGDNYEELILKMSITLDGFVGGPNGEIDWIFKTMSEDATAWTVDRFSRADAHLMGRKTFNDMAAYWPNSREVFAAPMNEIPKIVFSTKGFDPSQKGESSAALKDAIRMNRADGGNIVATLPPTNLATFSFSVVTSIANDLGVAKIETTPMSTMNSK